MISQLNKSPRKKLLIFFLINFLVFYLVNKLGHFIGFLDGEQTFAGELLHALWMGTFMTAFLEWKTVKKVFSIKKQDEE